MNTEELIQEARAANLVMWKYRCKWLEQKLRNDPSHVEALSKVVRRMGWTSISVSGLAEYVAKQKAKGKGLAAKFNAIAAATPWSVKRKYPIKAYCERYLGLKFTGKKCECPLHDGHSGNLQFVINEATSRWYCFGDCPPDPGHDHRSGDVIDLHRIVKGLASNEAALKDLVTVDLDVGLVGPRPNLFSSSSKPKTPKAVAPKPKTPKPVDTELVSKILADMENVNLNSPNGATAFDFAKLMLERILRPDDKPIVFFDKRELPRIVGRRARRLLERMPDKLQYLTSSVYIDEAGSNTNANIKERIFLDVEFDDMPLGDQLKVLWWLKRVKQWKLISITFSGSKSYHGLFDVRGQTKEHVEAMESLAKRLGACSGSLRPHNPIRFPGGLRRESPPALVRQEIIYLGKLTCC